MKSQHRNHIDLGRRFRDQDDSLQSKVKPNQESADKDLCNDDSKKDQISHGGPDIKKSLSSKQNQNKCEVQQIKEFEQNPAQDSSSLSEVEQRSGSSKNPSEQKFEGGRTSSQNVGNIDRTSAAGGNSQLNKSQMNRSQQLNQSTRQKREAKKLQKYDSNSIDEEEFQDYFSNPQKRKEFDRQRLQQQMREIQNIAGFSLGQFGNKQMKNMRDAFPAYPGADIEVGGQNANQKNYATVSLCCLSVTNPFRNRVIQLVAINPWFDRFILVVIIVNCFFLAVDKEIESITNNSDAIDFIFLVIYTMEMVFKIIAMGFVMRAHSYLRDSWNILDFLVVILGWLQFVISVENVTAIRVFRLLRPLRTINSMPGMSSLVSTILNSLPIMFDIMVLFMFMLVMFGTIFTQLLGGRLENRCYAFNIKGDWTNFLGHEKEEIFCMTDQDCAERQPYDVLESVCQYHGNPFRDTYKFDNVLISIVNIFQIITLEGWTEMMYIVRESEGTIAYDFLFVACVLFGAFFVLNLMIAVQFTYLGAAFDEEDRRQKEIKDKMNLKKRLKQQEEQENSFYDPDDESSPENQSQNDGRSDTEGQERRNNNEKVKKEKKKGICSCKLPDVIVNLSNSAEELVNKELFSTIIICFIILNMLFLASEHYGQTDGFTRAGELANKFFTIVFTVEMLLKLFGLGLKLYVQDGFNIFDAVIVGVSLFELFSTASSSGLSVLRAFRLVRVFKIIRSWVSLRKLLKTVMDSMSAIANLGVLTILFMFISALLAKQFFYEELLDDDGNPSRYSFSSTIQSLITIFIVITGENWNEIMIQVIDSSGSLTYPVCFFVAEMIIGNYMLLNLFLAILLKFISESDNEEQEGKEDATKIDTPRSQLPGAVDAQGQPIDDVFDNDQSANVGKKIAVDASGKQNVPNQQAFDIGDSGPLNSSNSNIEEEFEQIKLQLQQLSNMNMQQVQIANRQEKKSSQQQEQYEGGSQNYQNEFDENQGKSSRKGVSKQNSKNNVSQNLSNAGKAGSQNLNKISEMKNGKMVPINHVHLKTFAARSANLGKSKKKASIEIDKDSYALYIFAHNNCLRVWLKNLVENSYFEGFIYHMIALNSLLLMLDEPILVDEYQKNTIGTMLLIISIIFICECVSKIMVYGFIVGPKTYLKDNWNNLDFIIVLFSVLTWILESFDSLDISFMRGFRALRALRPLRVVSKSEGIKAVVNSLLEAIPALLNVILIIFLFLLVFGILGVQLFSGGIAFCNEDNPDFKTKEDCLSRGWFWVEQRNEVDELIGYVREESQWMFPFNNYNNVASSMLTFFEISTLEMWPDNMFNAIDSVGEDQVMIEGYAIRRAVIYVFYIFFTTFFIMNLFISVIVDKFNEEIKKRQGAHNFTEEQKEWVKIQRLLVHTNPKIIPVEPINCLRLQCFKIVQSQAFEYIIMLAIVINTLFLCIDYHQKSDELALTLEQANQTFVVIFTIEMVLKITAHGFKYYWHVNWNKFDFIIVWMSLVAIDEDLIKNLNFNVTALRIIRVSRLLRMVKTSEGLRSLLKTLYMSLGNILTTTSLLMLILFTFTVAGMGLFGDIPYGDHINANANFSSFYLSMLTLWRACTGESWNGLMHECYDNAGTLSIFFWLVFQLFTFFIFMNVFIAVIYENFNDVQASEDENDILSLKKKDIKAFQNTWAKYNPMGEVYMRTLRLPDFLRELPPPLGYQGIRIEESKLNKIIFCLNIKDHLGRVYYPEVMWTIFHSIVGINDEKVNNCEQINTILKIVKRKYKGLGKKVNLDSLCGNKYFRNELTAIKYIQAMKILTKWRNFKNIRIKQKEQQMMKQLTGAQPMNNKEKNGQDTNNSPNKRNTPKQQQEDKESRPKKKTQDEQQVEVNENSPDFIRNKRLENIKKRAEDNYQQDESIDDEADQQMPVTERGKTSSRQKPAISRQRKRDDSEEIEQDQRRNGRRKNQLSDDENSSISPNDINMNFKGNRR